MYAASSEHHRGQGNEHFRLARSQPAARVPDRRRHLWSALDCYKAGLAAAATPKDRSLCWKNSGVVHKELGLMEWAEGHKKRAWDHVHGSLEGYAEAWRHVSQWTAGAGYQGASWCERFVQQFAADLRALYSLTLRSETDEDLVNNLGRVCDLIGRYDFTDAEYLEVAGNVFIDTANRLLHVSVSLDKRLHYGRAFKYIAKMHFPIEEAARLLGRNRFAAFRCLESELSTLREDQRIQEVLFHSRVELEQGKSFLQNLGEQGGTMVDEALLGMDHLRAALCLISEDGIDIVLEAEVCSAIGNLCLSFFGAESSAEKHFKRCIELVLCHLTGDCEIGCRSESWYATAERGLRSLQERRAKRQDEERLKELEADGTLADLKANKERGSEHFLHHIYKKYPPEDASKVMPATDQPLKKRLTVALTHYHPDKIGKEDRRRYYLCEEITKYLNVFFETTKG